MSNSIMDLFRRTLLFFYDTYKETSDATKLAQGYLRGKCLYVTQNEVLMLNGEFKEDGIYFEPKGIKRYFRVKKRYMLKPDNQPLLVCYEGHTDTIDLNMVPEEVEFTKRIRNVPEDVQKNILELKAQADNEDLSGQVKGIDFETYKIRGADVLSSAAEDLMNNVHLRFIKSYPNWQILLIAIISLLVGMMVGGVLAVLASSMLGFMILGLT